MSLAALRVKEFLFKDYLAAPQTGPQQTVERTINTWLRETEEQAEGEVSILQMQQSVLQNGGSGGQASVLVTIIYSIPKITGH